MSGNNFRAYKRCNGVQIAFCTHELKHLLCSLQMKCEIFEFGTEIAPTGRFSTMRSLIRHPSPDERQHASISIPSPTGNAEKVTDSPCFIQMAPQIQNRGSKTKNIFVFDSLFLGTNSFGTLENF